MVVATEKVTITIPCDMKTEIAKIKEDMKVSMNSIYQSAIKEYLTKKKRERLRKEAESMVSYYETNEDAVELLKEAGDIYEY